MTGVDVAALFGAVVALLLVAGYARAIRVKLAPRAGCEPVPGPVAAEVERWLREQFPDDERDQG